MSEWQDTLRLHSSLLDDSFFETLSERLESALVAWDYDSATCLAFVGDLAARLKHEKFRFGLKVTKDIGSAPFVVDLRDGSMFSFPGSGYRGVETVLPLLEE